MKPPSSRSGGGGQGRHGSTGDTPRGARHGRANDSRRPGDARQGKPGHQSPRPQSGTDGQPARHSTPERPAHKPRRAEWEAPSGPTREQRRATGSSSEAAVAHQRQKPPHSTDQRLSTGHASAALSARAGRDPRHEGPRRGDSRGGAEAVQKGTVWLYGHHAVAAALANPARRLRRLLVTEEGEAALTERLAAPWAIQAERIERPRLDHLLGREVVHQGLALLADTLPPPSLHQTLERPGPILVLDQVTDPRNVGAILRSAAAFGAAGVIIQDRNAPEETGAVAKAASGALETVPLLRAVNITRTLIALKAANLWCVGLDAGGDELSGPAFADRRLALVLGAEGSGLRRLTRETCDMIAGLAIKGGMDSLNVSAAAAVALYEVTRGQKQAAA